MIGQTGAAQRRALIALAATADGVGEVPFLSAPGLMNKGMVIRLGRASSKPNAAYICQLTEFGRAVAAQLRAADAQGAGADLIRHAA